MMDRALLLRRARGYAPLPFQLDQASPPILAVGGHFKNTVALVNRDQVFISQHIGDLENAETFGAFRRVVTSFEGLYETRPIHVASDLHPDYLSTTYAESLEAPLTRVQHHYAHIAACMVENRLDGEVLGVSWDGTGYGRDGTIWGGEFLLADRSGFTRMATFRRFRLPGGAAAIGEPRRSALGALYELLGSRLDEQVGLAPLASFSDEELRVLQRMLATGVNAPFTSSAGRLFDVVAAVAGIRQRVHYEGQAAMELEFAARRDHDLRSYSFELRQGPEEILVDWRPTLRDILDTMAGGTTAERIAARFHGTLADIIVEVARRAGNNRVLLTGGCFQNKVLTECAVTRLRQAGFKPYWHQRIPPNDGAISLGQAAVAAWKLSGSH
jgi:hydrogenase maturation protein HypF